MPPRGSIRPVDNLGSGFQQSNGETAPDKRQGWERGMEDKEASSKQEPCITINWLFDEETLGEIFEGEWEPCEQRKQSAQSARCRSE